MSYTIDMLEAMEADKKVTKDFEKEEEYWDAMLDMVGE